MNKNNNVKCVLFDIDGVIIRSETFSDKYQRKYGISNKEMTPFFTGIFQECLIGNADLKAELIRWLPKWKWKHTIDEFLSFWFEAKGNIDQQIIKRVEKLRKNDVLCYLATNQEKYRTAYMKKMYFESLFDGMYSSANIGHKKPEKKFYQFILSDLEESHNIKTNEIIFFDDDQKNVNGARNIKIKSYLYTNVKKFDKIIKQNYHTNLRP